MKLLNSDINTRIFLLPNYYYITNPKYMAANTIVSIVHYLQIFYTVVFIYSFIMLHQLIQKRNIRLILATNVFIQNREQTLFKM